MNEEPTVPAARRVVVVVPARDEETVVGGCLAVLAHQAGEVAARGWSMEVTVVCGGCRDRTAEVARRWVGRGRALAGRVVELDEPGKAVALDAGDAVAGVAGRGDGLGMVVYLDADVRLADGALAACARAVEEGSHLVGCRPVVDRPQTWMARAYARTWLSLPSVVADAAGAGCFVVSAEGRARWGAFPHDLPDDAFVRSLFAPEERRVVEAHAVVRFPEADTLVGVVARWRAGNRRLHARGLWGARTPRWRTALAVLASPRALSGLPVFLVVNAAARRHRGQGWARAR